MRAASHHHTVEHTPAESAVIRAARVDADVVWVREGGVDVGVVGGTPVAHTPEGEGRPGGRLAWVSHTGGRDKTREGSDF